MGGAIFRRPPADGAATYPVCHLATFPLPADRGDFGHGAVDSMGTNDAFLTLFEYGPESVGTPPFASEGLPTRLSAAEFDPAGVARTVEGLTGVQRFFRHGGRAFCLYVVLGSHARRAVLVPIVNSVLATVQSAGRRHGVERSMERAGGRGGGPPDRRGVAKFLRPHGLPIPPALVRGGAIVEGAVGAAALLVGGSAAHLAVAASYLAFAGFVVWARTRRVPLRSCGCLGETDTPPTSLHVAINLALAATALGAGIAGVSGWPTADLRPVEWLPAALLVGIGTWAGALALRWLPARSVLKVPAHRTETP